jgi:hypothetical protein
VGPLTTVQGNYMYAVVAVEYFTKWIEAKPLVNIAATGLRTFFWLTIISRFGVPRKITVDNTKQFDCHIFKDFCHQMGVEAAFTLVYHPQSNGAVEKSKHTDIHSHKKIVEDQPKGKWVEELPRAVWSHNTSICRATKFTPFKLLYGEESVTPEETKLCSARTRAEATYSPTKARVWRYKNVKKKHIKAGDLVFLQSPHIEASGKLEPK